MPGRPSDIPVGTQFSPDLINLPGFLAAAIQFGGDKEALANAVWEPGVRIKAPTNRPTHRVKNLPLEAAVQYGILTPKTYEATDLVHELAALTGADLDDAFARHILMTRGGLRVVEAAQQMRMDSLRVTGDTLAEYLSDQGFAVTVHNTAINTLRMWLARAGVFEANGWGVHAKRKQEILGLDDESIATLVGFTEEQRAFAIALCRINPTGDYPAAEVRNLAEQIVGHRFARESLPNVVLEPLKRAGLIEYETKGTGGGKTSVLRTTSKFNAEVLEPFIEHAVQSLDAQLTAYYRKPPATIYSELGSADTYVRGMALEAYAVHIMRLLGLRFVGWRKRAQETTGRAEIDVVLTGTIGGLPSRWQVQCKNKPSGQVNLEDVAKEVGLLPLTKATHVMVLANARFTADARTYAREIMRHTSVFIFLLDVNDFERIRKSPGELPLILREQAEQASVLRRGTTMWDF